MTDRPGKSGPVDRPVNCHSCTASPVCFSYISSVAMFSQGIQGIQIMRYDVRLFVFRWANNNVFEGFAINDILSNPIWACRRQLDLVCWLSNPGVYHTSVLRCRVNLETRTDRQIDMSGRKRVRYAACGLISWKRDKHRGYWGYIHMGRSRATPTQRHRG